MKSSRHTLLLALSLLSSLPAFGQSQVPETGFLCCNMRSDGKWISDSNYAESGKRVIPLGTAVRFLGYGRYRVYVEIESHREALGNDYSRDLTQEAFAARYIVTTNPRDELANVDPKIRMAIETARVARGMTRAQVIMAMGYPISSENPHLDVRQYRYWLWSFSPFTINFGEDGMVSSVTTDAETLPKVFLD